MALDRSYTLPLLCKAISEPSWHDAAKPLAPGDVVFLGRIMKDHPDPREQDHKFFITRKLITVHDNHLGVKSVVPLYVDTYAIPHATSGHPDELQTIFDAFGVFIVGKYLEENGRVQLIPCADMGYDELYETLEQIGYPDEADNFLNAYREQRKELAIKMEGMKGIGNDLTEELKLREVK